MAKKKKKRWIQDATKNRGALTAKAKAKGKTPAQFCSSGNLSSKSQKQCNLRKTLMGLKRKKKKG